MSILSDKDKIDTEIIKKENKKFKIISAALTGLMPLVKFLTPEDLGIISKLPDHNVDIILAKYLLGARTDLLLRTPSQTFTWGNF